MAARDYFAADYQEARRKFRDAATRAGAALEKSGAVIEPSRSIAQMVCFP